MEIKRHTDAGSVSTDKMVDYCLSQLEEQDDFVDVEWKTQVVDGLTVEELIGALVAAEYELEQQEFSKPPA
jgi:hypothetical protein